jgi:hypothetical protein
MSDHPVYENGRIISADQWRLERERERIEREVTAVEADVALIGAALEQQREAIADAQWRLRKHAMQRRALQGKVIYRIQQDALLNR